MFAHARLVVMFPAIFALALLYAFRVISARRFLGLADRLAPGYDFAP